MKKTDLFLVLVIVALGGGLWILSRQKAEPVAVVQPQPKPRAVQPTEVPPAPIVVDQPAPETSVNVTVQTKPRQATPVQTQNNPPANAGKEPLHDPAARDALALVGFDPSADQYWLDAIFDTSLPDNEREDLMEDLNETGFADPKNLTSDDLPLIISRLEIIDVVLPNADDFMAEHLLEAQKDLVNMLANVGQ